MPTATPTSSRSCSPWRKPTSTMSWYRDVCPRAADSPVSRLPHHGDSANFVIYTATVTATFLTRFMMPHRGPSSRDGSTGMEISYTPVRVWPLLGLKERLAKALGSGIRGHPVHDSADQIGFWDPLVGPQAARKRRCSDDRTVPSAAKKRRAAGSHLGVVHPYDGGRPSGQTETLFRW